MRPDPQSGEEDPGRNQRRWHGPPGWRRMHHRPAALFFRLLFSFGFLALLTTLIVSLPLFAFSERLPGPPGMRDAFRGGACVISLVVVAAVFLVGRRTFRSIAGPLGEVMDAADRVAEGDLTARVPETGGPQFRQLARSFNRMTTELEQADRQRRNLTADVAHELRNPLHIIQGNLEGILDGVYAPDAAHIQNTLDETRLLSRLVDDLQTLSLAEAGQLHLRAEPVRIAELIEDVRISFSGQAEEAGVALQAEVSAGAGETVVQADYERMQQVLGNLVANALRFTPSGGRVRLGAERLVSSLRLIVEDTGAGIPAEDLPHIFDRFWKGDKARTRREGSGSGLGLAIAAQLVRAQGGSISVRSEIGQGTRFAIELPLEGNAE